VYDFIISENMRSFNRYSTNLVFIMPIILRFLQAVIKLKLPVHFGVLHLDMQQTFYSIRWII